MHGEGTKDRQTDGHRDSMTESAQWANSVKILCTLIYSWEDTLALEAQRWQIAEPVQLQSEELLVNICPSSGTLISWPHEN